MLAVCSERGIAHIVFVLSGMRKSRRGGGELFVEGSKEGESGVDGGADGRVPRAWQVSDFEGQLLECAGEDGCRAKDRSSEGGGGALGITARLWALVIV